MIDDETAFECASCRRDLQQGEPAICHGCTGKVRADLYAIQNAHGLLPGVLEVGSLGSNMARRDRHRSDERPIPGGAALVMLAGGSGATQRRRAYLAGNDDSWDQDDSPGDPLSIGYELGRHEDDWRLLRGEQAAGHSYFVVPAVRYLLLALGWAASRHPGFPDFGEDIRRLRRQLECVVGADEDGMRAEAPCIDCNGILERRYRPLVGGNHDAAGLEDDWTCRRCKRTYTQPAYYLAVRSMLEARAVDE